MGLAISLTPTILSWVGWNQNYQVWQSSNVCHSFLSSQAPKYLPRKCEDLVRNVFRHLSHSPKRMHQYKKLRVFCASKPNKARWLFQRAAVERLLVAASSILFFKQELWRRLTYYQEYSRDLVIQCWNYFTSINYILPNFNTFNLLFNKDPKFKFSIKKCFDLYEEFLGCYIKSEEINTRASHP